MLRVLSSEIDLYPGSQEERLPGFSAQFPHITSYALLPDDPAQGCIWHWHKSLELFRVEQHRPLSPAAPGRTDPSSEKVKQMLLFLHAHYAEKLSVSAIAAAAYCSERACYRCFQECLHTSPGEYLQNFRLQMASKLLIETDLPITEIAQHCGLGSSSHFGAQFRQRFGCSPSAYRAKWQDPDTQRQKDDSLPAASGAILKP